MIDFIIADCHIALQSPQHALSSFARIHDKKTIFGTITSENIADSLNKKIDTLSRKNPLLKKLCTKSCYFASIDRKLRIDRIGRYAEEYSCCTVDQLVSTLSSTKDPEQLSIIMTYLEQHAQRNNLRALCIITAAYNNGLYGITQCTNTALSYAQQYIGILATSQPSIPLEQFRIQKILHDNKQLLQAPLHLYYDYLQAVRNNNHEIALSALNKLKSYSNPLSYLRNIVVDLCKDTPNNTAIKKIKESETKNDFDKDIMLFIKAEGDVVIPLLQSQLGISKACLESIHYFLALL